MNVGKKIAIGINVTIIGALIFWTFDRYTGSEAFVKKDMDASNRFHLSSFEEARKICDGMSSFSHVEGLTDGAFIPFGGRTYYYKSSCYQELARETLDDSLCQKVSKRWPLLGDGSGVSSSECLRQVTLAHEAQSQRDKEAKHNRDVTEGEMEITRAWVDPLTQDQWRVNVQVEGKLFGNYRFDVEASNLEQNKILVSEKTSLQVSNKLFSWVIKKGDLMEESVKGPHIVSLAVSLYYLLPEGIDFPGKEKLTSIGNASISVE
jgi:hypothetical protein